MPRYAKVLCAEGGDSDMVTSVPYTNSATGSEGATSPTTSTAPTTPMTATTTVSTPASQGAGGEVPAAQAQGTRLPGGQVTPARDLITMRIELHQARNAGDFPSTVIPASVPEATVQDYDMLTRLRELRGDTNSPPSDEYNRHLVDCHRVIQQRDYKYKANSKEVTVDDQIQRLLRNQNVGADLHGIVQHAAASGVQRVLASSPTNGNPIHDMVQQTFQNLVDEGFDARKLLDMDSVVEDLFAVVEATALDATGPLRLNVNRMGSMLNATETNVNRMGVTQNNFQNEVRNLNTQVGAMNNHVSAVGSHVTALGALMQVLNTISTSTNTQIGQLNGQVGTQLEDIQALVNILPNLIQDVVREVLPQALQTTLVPILLAAAQSGGANTKTSVKKQTKKRGFFSRLFKRGGKDGSGGPSGSGMAC